jgi:hypothetical protein
MKSPHAKNFERTQRPAEAAAHTTSYLNDDLSLATFFESVRGKFGSKPLAVLRENMPKLIDGLAISFAELSDEARSVQFEVIYFKDLADLIEAYIDRVVHDLGAKFVRPWRMSVKGERSCQINLANIFGETVECRRSIDDIGLAGKVIRYEFHREAYVPIPTIGSNIRLRGASRFWKKLDHLKGYLEGAFLRSGLPENSKVDFEKGVQSLISTLSKKADDVGHQHLCIPDGIAPVYEGKKKSGSIVDFLRNAYPPREGGEPLTLQFLREHDPKAHTALYNHQRKEPLPDDLHLPRQTAASDSLLARYGVDLNTPDGAEEARRLAGIIYGRLKFEPRR